LENSVLPLAQFIAIFATSIFAGAAIYINLVEQPARMGCSTELAATQWAPSYKRATLMQAPLAIIGFLSGLVAWWLGAGPLWLVAALLILAVVPFTLLVIEPGTNKQLLIPGRDLSSPETRHLLVKWGRLHAVRTVLGLLASAIFIWQAVGA
jgi:uncharacterized membrane protein